jgi:DNA invertase Pin-like site-specific DNA recombinase
MKDAPAWKRQIGDLLATVNAAIRRPECRHFFVAEPRLNSYGIGNMTGKGANRTMQAQRFIGYIRVSTAKQGASGLGLDAQKRAVADFVQARGGELLKEFREVESGKRNDRPELRAALAAAKRAGASLVVAKLDRLSRNVAFLATLMESGVEFTCCDNPHATPFTIHILAAVAEWEREQISKRTRAAMQEAKGRGQLFGSAVPGKWEGRESVRDAALAKGRRRAAKVRADKARSEYADLLPQIQAMRGAGKSLAEIAEALNTEGHTTRTGKPFGKVQVSRILDRAAK